MPYRIEFRGTQVICDTVAEVKAMLAGDTPLEVHARWNDMAGMQQGHNEFATVMVALPNTQGAFLRLLARRVDMSDADARALLKLETNKGLAGVLAGIHIRFKTAGIANPVRSEKRFKDRKATYRYWLSEADRQKIQATSAESN